MGEARGAPAPLYGGQAVVEGVMMRGADHWAVAVRRPDGRIHVESHEIRSIQQRHPIWRRPGLRGMVVLGQSLVIGVRALMIAANVAAPEEERLTSRQAAASLVLALVLFLGVFILGPATLFAWFERRVGGGLWVNVVEGLFRVLLLVAYLWLIGRAGEIRRVFAYHGAEHKTIAAHEHGEPLVVERIDRFAKEHVRCGTNFLLIVMITTIFVFALFGTPPLPWRLVSRIVAIPLIAAIAYEALRLGARYSTSPLMRALMAPGLWLQRITTREPDADQIEVAVAAFREVQRREAEAAADRG